MNRSTLDKLISSTGLVIAILLLAAAGGLFYAYNFVHSQVYDQLAEQKIVFPEKGSKALEALPEADRKKIAEYAGQPLVTGAQAKVFADNYIAVHLDSSGDGKTYSEVSTAARANPNDPKLAKQVETLFKGETLRGMLLNAYAFDTMALVAKYAAIASLAGGLLLVVLSAFGFRHAGVAAKTQNKKRA